MVNYIPKIENITGADLTGVGPTGRTYVLSNADSVVEGLIVQVAGSVLQYSDDFTFSSGTLTFVVPVFDSQNITINYNIASTSSSSGTLIGYASTLDVVRYGGFGINIFNEVVGTGDSSEDSYDLDNFNIIDGSYSLQYAASGSNDLTTLTETTHYTLDKNSGVILLTSAGVTALGTNVLYATYVYSPKINDDELSFFLLAAEEEVNRATGNYWGGVKSSTEYFDGYDASRFVSTDRPFNDDYDEPDSLIVSNKSVQSVTSVDFLDKTGVSQISVDSDYIDFNSWGEIILQANAIPNGKHNVKVVYTHGYDSINPLVRELTCLYVAVMTFDKITGGSYDDATMVSLGRKSVSIGEVYVNVREAIKNYESRISTILKRLGPTIEVA